MKILGVFLIVAGILCFAFVFTGLFAWTTPVTEGATPASLSITLNAKMLIFSGLGALCVVAGTIAFIRGILMSRGTMRKNED